ncbi:DUF2510 domain-containing protein [Rhodococcoides yunnanense]|uniref:DUF2510 domain-containing protein n=1 Tax=Rhodococcoides yunnanense TaxID=278209 RepID=UPI0009353078
MSPFHVLIILVVVAVPVIVVGAIVYAVVSSSRRSANQLVAQPFVAPGWYADPQNPGQRRWFDGAQWTDSTTP